MGGADERDRGSDHLPQLQLVVPGREHSRQAAPVHADGRRLPDVCRTLRGGSARRLQRLLDPLTARSGASRASLIIVRSFPFPRGCVSMRLRSSAVVVLGLAAIALVACGAKESAPAAGGGGPPQMPPPQVGVVTMQPRSVALRNELPGRVEALRVAQVRARVNGVVLKRQFTEGSDVKAGQPLFQIDPAPYQAALDSAQAAVAKAQANRAMATELAMRYKPLAE